jgi:hypothetical protein
MSELSAILQIAAGVGLFFTGRIVVISGKKCWWTGLIIALGGYLVVANVFGIV